MHSRRYFGQPSNGICNDESLAALLTSTCSPFQGVEDRPLYPIFESSEGTAMEDDLGDEGSQRLEKKRRLTMEQVKSLEKSFELEDKLEPERKLELARDLGLQPRQVAVWFQNRRARWKSKRLEKDYDVLKNNYNSLKADFDALSREKDRLQAKVNKLNQKLGPAESEEQKVETGQPSLNIKTEVEESRLQHKIKPSSSSSSSDQISHNPLSNFVSVVCKKEFSCSESEASEILDVESPRQIESGLSLQQNHYRNQTQDHSQDLLAGIQLQSDPATNLLQISEDLYRSAYQRLVPGIRWEEKSCQEDNCNRFPALEDPAAISWWDW